MRRLPAFAVLLLSSCLLPYSHAAAQTPPPEPTIVEVTVEQEGQIITDPSITSLIETRVGQPLRIRDVKETIRHLVSLNRFEDIQPLSEQLANGVKVRWALFPLHPIDRVEFTGMTGLSGGDLQRALTERYGVTPTEGHVDEARETLLALLKRRGYPNARISTRIVPTHDPDRATLYFDVEAGTRGTITDLRMTQRDAEQKTTITDVPNIKQGQPYDEDVLQRELQAWETRMRSRGFYEARTSRAVQWVDNDAVVFINLTRGPRVSVAFAGDPLPENERDRLVPIKSEGSADEDLLEDASRAIENYLHVRGYRDATAPFTRDERDGELVITFTVKRGSRYLTRNVRFSGNESIPAERLAEIVRLKDGEPFVRATLNAGVQAVVNTYRAGGFTRAQVKANDVVSLPDNLNGPDRGIDVTIAITEGPRTVVHAVAFQGNMAVSEADLQRLTVVSPGRAYVAGEMVADRDRIATEYRNRGYESAAVSSETMFVENDTQVDVRFTISEGPLIRVDHIIIVGNRRTSEKTIRNELTLHEGEPLGEAALAESRSRLYGLGLFRRASIETVTHGGEAQRDLIVQLEESPPTILGMGGGLEGGYQTRTGPTGLAEEQFELAPRGFFQIGRRNLFGKNRTVNLYTRASLRSRNELPPTDSTAPAQTSYGFHEYRIVPSFQEPRVFGLRGTLQIQGILEQAIRTSYNFIRREARVQGDLNIARAYHLTGLYSLQRTELFDITDPSEKPLIDRIFPSVRLSKFSGSLSRDTRDDILDPSIGTFSVATADIAARAIGSEVGFIKTYLQGFTYRRLPVSRRVVLALGARLGLAHGFPRTQEGQEVRDLPASERFYAGGDTSVRGFTLDRLVNEETITPSGYPTGGNGVVVLNSEMRVNLFGKFQGAGFIDAGNVFPRASEFTLTGLRPAAGFGVMYQSPVGPLRVDLGINLDPKTFPSGTERRYVVHILLGQAF
jgi:outer membrane protein assembly complex protein YaeT